MFTSIWLIQLTFSTYRIITMIDVNIFLKLINNSHELLSNQRQTGKYKENQYRGERFGGRNHRRAFSLIFSQNTGSFEKYVEKLVRRTSSDFKTPRSSLDTCSTRLRLVFAVILYNHIIVMEM